jgi:pimeloyl-ACP methyl ester carboxylesterase
MCPSPSWTLRRRGRTAAPLLHGKNFCAATWEATITTLTGAGYRVIAAGPDRLLQSTKPERHQYSLQLAENTRALLTSRGVGRATIVGDSMGGMLAARYALMYPDAVEQLVMVNPLGLEDWQAEGVPFADVDRNYRTELTTASAECFHQDRPDQRCPAAARDRMHPRARDPLRDRNHGAIVGAPVPPWVVAASVALEKSAMR